MRSATASASASRSTGKRDVRLRVLAGESDKALVRRSPRAVAKRSGIGLTAYTTAVVSVWLGVSYVLADLIFSWDPTSSLLLFVSAWALCAIGLGPAVVWAHRIPVWVYERRISGAEGKELPITLSEPLRRLVTDTRTLLLLFDSEYVDVATAAPNLWRWTKDVEALPDADAALLAERGLSEQPIREALQPNQDNKPDTPESQAKRRAQVITTLNRFETELTHPTPSPYR